MGVAKEYPDLYGTKPGTKAASLWDQWHVLQEQNKPKPVENYHIDFNSNKVEKTVAPQIPMPSTGKRQMTAPGKAIPVMEASRERYKIRKFFS